MSYEDAELVAPEFWRFNGNRVKETRWNTMRLGRLYIPLPEPVYASGGEESRENKELLHFIPDRLMAVHVQGDASPVLLRTMEMPRDRLAASRKLVPRLKAMAYPPCDAESAREAGLGTASPGSEERSYEWAGP